MKILLKDWIQNPENNPGTEMYWYSAYWDQVNFVKDYVAMVMSRTYKEWQEIVEVIGTHTSKSIKCPVYRLRTKDATITMRYNFHDWNISVDSEKPIDVDFFGAISEHPETFYGMEGMPGLKYPPYERGSLRFTVLCYNDYDCYMFFRIMKRALGIVVEKES